MEIYRRLAQYSAILAIDTQGSIVRHQNTHDGTAFCYTAFGHTPFNGRALRFTAQVHEPFEGYVLGKGYRVYSPILMRFLSVDSLSPFAEGGINAYVYCGGDPVNHIDPSGHMPQGSKHSARRSSVPPSPKPKEGLVNGSQGTTSNSASPSAEASRQRKLSGKPSDTGPDSDPPMIKYHRGTISDPESMSESESDLSDVDSGNASRKPADSDELTRYVQVLPDVIRNYRFSSDRYKPNKMWLLQVRQGDARNS